MAGAREFGEVKKHPLEDNETFDDEGYVVVADKSGDNKVHKHKAGTAADYDGTNPIVGVNYASTENQNEDVVFPESGQTGVVEDSSGQPVQADAAEYFLGDEVYLSQTNDGHVNKSDTTSARLGRVVEYNDLTGGAGKILVKYTTA